MIKKKITIEIECDTYQNFNHTLNLITDQIQYGFTEGFNNSPSPPNSYNFDVDVISDNDESEVELDIFIV